MESNIKERSIIFSGRQFYRDKFENEVTIQADDFDTIEASEKNSDVVKMFQDKELQNEDSEKSKNRRGIWFSEDKVLLGKRLLVSFTEFLSTLASWPWPPENSWS